MTKARAKTNAIRNAGQKTPGGVATRNPKASHDGASPKESPQKHETLRRKPVRETAEGLDHRFLRSQPRVIGLGLLLLQLLRMREDCLLSFLYQSLDAPGEPISCQ